MPEENKIDYTGIQVPNIESVRKTVQQFTDWRRSMGFQTEEEKNAALKAEMQAAQQRFNDQDLWNSEDLYEVYNAYETDPAKQAEFQRNGQMVAGVGSTIATLPFTAGMIGWVPALTTTATGAVGGYAGAYGGQKLGQHLDNKYGWNTTPWLSTIGGIGGGILGGGLGYRGTVQLGSRGWLPKGGQTMYSKQFVGDVAADGINRNIHPISQFNKTVLQKRMDAYTSDRFVRDNLWFPQNIDETKIRVEPEWDYVTSPQKDIFESPRTLIHWDGAATGNNSPKNVLTIGRPISKMTGVAHFENGKLVPAKTAIDVKKGPSFNSTNHPLMFSDYEPWFETPMTGRHLDWLDRFGDEKMWKWRLSKYGNELYTDYPHRIITIDSDTPGIKIQRGTHFGNRNSHEYYTGSIPISKIKEGFEWDPTIKTWGRVRYVDPSKTSSKSSYALFERPSKLTWEERLGIPKGERNNGKTLLSMQDLVPQKFTSISGLKPIGGKMIADKVVNHPYILDRTRRLQQTYKRMVDPDYTPTNNWRKSRGISPGMKIVDDIDVTRTNSPTGTTENIGGYYNPSEDMVYVRRRGTPDAQASVAFHEELHGYDFGQDTINDWIIKHLIDPEKVKGMSPRAQKYYLGSQEAPVHALQHGFNKGLDIGAPYPGDAAFDELLDSGIGGSLYYFKTQTPKDKRRLWRAMTGDLFVKRQGGKIENPDH